MDSVSQSGKSQTNWPTNLVFHYTLGGLVSTGSRRSPTHSLPSLCLSASVPTEVDLVSMEISGPEPRRD